MFQKYAVISLSDQLHFQCNVIYKYTASTVTICPMTLFFSTALIQYLMENVQNKVFSSIYNRAEVVREK